MNYYISDLHLGHENIIKSMGRPYNNVNEMDKVLISRWNNKVNEDDDIYIIGDFSDKDENVVELYVNKLVGRKHLIIGNHDKYWMEKEEHLSDYFESISYMDIINDGDKTITLCHYPMFEWSLSRYITSQQESRSWLIHGHIHNSRDCDAYFAIKKSLVCSLNAGVEINNYEPVSIEELIINNNKWYERS